MEQHADGRYGTWRLIDRAWGDRVDGGDPAEGSLYKFNASTGNRVQIAHVTIQNRAGGNANIGFGVRLSTSMWKMGQWTHGTTTYTDDTTDFQSSATNDAALETTTNGDGFLVQSPVIFTSISVKVQTVSTGTPTRVIEYSAAGGVWTSISNFLSFSASGANWVSGENGIWWGAPTAWVPMEAGHGTGITVGWYGLRVRATTAPTIAGVASSATVHRIYGSREAVADNGIYEINFGGIYAPMEVEGESLVACTNFANAQNLATMLIRTRE